MSKIKRSKRDTEFVLINKQPLQDTSLSWKAKGLLSYLLSLPDDWQIYVSELQKHSKDGRDSTRSALNELIDAGYVQRDFKEREEGKFQGYDYIVYESKEQSSPKTENPKTVNPNSEKPQLLSNNNTNNNNKLLIGANIPDSFSQSLIDVFIEYLEMRVKKKKKLVTKRQVEKKIARVEKYLNEYGEQKTIDCIDISLDYGWTDINISYLENHKPSRKTDNNELQYPNLLAYLETHEHPAQLKIWHKQDKIKLFESEFNENKFKLTNIAKAYQNPTICPYFIYEILYMPLGRCLGGSSPDRKLESFKTFYKTLNDYNQKHGNIIQLIQTHAQKKVL